MSIGFQVKTAVVTLVGNPNSGKTSLFNHLTGSQQKVANYAGVTVEVISGVFEIDAFQIKCYDVPGLYSLNPISMDEEVAAKALLGEMPLAEQSDLFIYVLDACNLERSLFLLSQVINLDRPMMVALTMSDLLHSSYNVDIEKLEILLGIEVIQVFPYQSKGILEFKKAISRNLVHPRYPLPFLQNENSYHEETIRRYEWASKIRSAVLSDEASKNIKLRTDWIDKFLTHRFFGLASFIVVMFLVFQSIYTFSKPLTEGIESLFDAIGGLTGKILGDVPIIHSLLADGIFRGLGTMLSFLPQIAILFFFIALLESTGYLARAAFLMDRLFGWCGLSGRAFIPLLSSFSCAIPGIMAARVIPDQRSRLATILVSPLMSCSARLPVYILMIGAFVEPQLGPVWAGVTLFGMHLLGLLVAIPVLWLLNRKIFKKQTLPFIFELPPYHLPKWKNIWQTVYLRVKVFVRTAGTMIIAMSILIWGLLYFPRFEGDFKNDQTEYMNSQNQTALDPLPSYTQQRQLEDSYLGRFAKKIEPIFIPAGFDWRLTTAILTAFPAREVMVSSLGILFDLGGGVDASSKDLRQALRSAKWPDGRLLMTPWTGVGLMVFFALCCQCMATLATVKRETNSWKWPVILFIYMSILAYLGAVGIHQLEKILS